MPAKSGRDFSKETFSPSVILSGDNVSDRAISDVNRRILDEAIKGQSTPGEKKARSAKRKRDALRTEKRYNLEFPKEVKTLFNKYSKELGIPASQLVVWAAYPGLKQIVETKGACLKDYQTVSRSGAWQYNLDLEKRKNE